MATGGSVGGVRCVLRPAPEVRGFQSQAWSHDHVMLDVDAGLPALNESVGRVRRGGASDMAIQGRLGKFKVPATIPRIDTNVQSNANCR